MKKRRHTCGFTLVELIVTIGLVAMIMLLFLTLLSTSTNVLLDARKTAAAVQGNALELEEGKGTLLSGSGSTLEIPFEDQPLSVNGGYYTGTAENGELLIYFKPD